MDQRPLRLGDIVDDYCPRERRITNHAVVALVGEEIRQTRCTTCDVEHPYKQAKPPKRVAGRGGLNGPPDAGPGQLVPRAAAPADPSEKPGAVAADAAPVDQSADESTAGTPNGNSDADGDQPAPIDGWLAHRPLIRATLPRTEGEPPAPRPIPEFTMHQRQPQGRGFRFGQGRHGGNGQPHNGFGSGFGDDRQGNGNNSHPGNGQGQPGNGGGRRRRRRGGRNRRAQ